MTLASQNVETRFPKALAPLLPEHRQQYVLVDIGARGGVEATWKNFEGIADFIGFEPHLTECANLNKLAQDQGLLRHRVYPHAIADKNGVRPYYVTKFAHSCGLYRANEDWMGRFPYTTLDVVRQVEIETVTLDYFCAKEALGHVDFLKIDVEGAEYDVLEGGLQTLTDRKVLGIKTEFWWDPIAKGQRSFAEIDMLLRANGFRFYDLELHRYARSTLPAGPVRGTVEEDGSITATNDPVPDYGQAWTGDALYFRDPVGDLKAGEQSISWDRDSLLRLCGLLDAFDYGDCAIEILETFRHGLLDGIDVDPLIDAALPLVGGEAATYDAYRAASIGIRQRHNAAAHNLSDWQPPPTGYKARS